MKRFFIEYIRPPMVGLLAFALLAAVVAIGPLLADVSLETSIKAVVVAFVAYCIFWYIGAVILAVNGWWDPWED